MDCTAILRLAVGFLLSLFKSQRQLILENLALKQQVALLRQSVKRPRSTAADKIFWILFSRYAHEWRQILYGLNRMPLYGGIGRASACNGGGKADTVGLEGQPLMPLYAN